MTTHPRTEWYPADIDPVRFGWYEVERPGFKFGIIALDYTTIGWRYAYDVGLCKKGDFARMDAYMGDKWRGMTSEVVG